MLPARVRRGAGHYKAGKQQVPHAVQNADEFGMTCAEVGAEMQNDGAGEKARGPLRHRRYERRHRTNREIGAPGRGLFRDGGGGVEDDVQRGYLRRLGVAIHEESLAVFGHVVGVEIR